jgi:pimeloyl-ACP methyl ester carboxylesterase
MSMFKPHLLLVHGNWGDSCVWDILLPHLRAEGYRVTAIRMPCRGDPSVAQQGFDDYVKAIKYEALKIKRSEGVDPVIVGHSLGGTLALKAAEEGCGCGLILIAPSPPSDFPQPTFSWANLRLFGPWLFRSIAAGSFQWPYRPGFSAMRLLFAGWPEDAIRAEYERMHQDSGTILGEFLKKSPPTRVALDRIAVPVLCIAGTADPVSSPETVRALAASCRAEFQEFGGSHFLLSEASQAPIISKRISIFLDSRSWDHLRPWPHLRSDWKGTA